VFIIPANIDVIDSMIDSEDIRLFIITGTAIPSTITVISRSQDREYVKRSTKSLHD